MVVYFILIYKNPNGKLYPWKNSLILELYCLPLDLRVGSGAWGSLVHTKCIHCNGMVFITECILKYVSYLLPNYYICEHIYLFIYKYINNYLYI